MRPPLCRPWASRQRLWLLGILCGLSLSCGYRLVGANPVTIACMFPVENLSHEVGAGQVFDKALRARLGRAGGGAPSSVGASGGEGCLGVRLLQVAQHPLANYGGRVTHMRLDVVLELRLERGGFHPIRVSESEEFGSDADILLTEASLRAALVRLADKAAQKAFEQMQMQWP